MNDLICKKCLQIVDSILHILTNITISSQLNLWFHSVTKSFDFLTKFPNIDFNSMTLIRKGTCKMLTKNALLKQYLREVILLLYEEGLLILSHEEHNIIQFVQFIPIKQIKVYEQLSTDDYSNLHSFIIRSIIDKEKTYYKLYSSKIDCYNWVEEFLSILTRPVSKLPSSFINPSKEKAVKYNGSSISSIISQESQTHHSVPRVFARIIDELLTRGLSTPYICTKEFNLSTAHEIRKKVVSADFNKQYSEVGVKVLGTLLRNMLKDVKPRLFGGKSSSSFSKITTITTSTLNQVTTFLNSLESTIYCTTEYLFLLFHVIACNRQFNSVSIDDLAKFFAPALLENPTPQQVIVIAFMIKHYHKIFVRLPIDTHSNLHLRHVLLTETPTIFLATITTDVYAVSPTGNCIVFDRDDPLIPRRTITGEPLHDIISVFSYKSYLFYIQAKTIIQMNTFTNERRHVTVRSVKAASLVGDLIWLVTTNSIYLYDPKTLVEVKKVVSESSSYKRICVGHSVVWVAVQADDTSDVRIYVYSASTATFLTALTMERKTVIGTMEFCETSNTLWVGTVDGIIFVYSANDNSLLHIIDLGLGNIMRMATISEYVVVMTPQFQIVIDSHNFVLFSILHDDLIFNCSLSIDSSSDSNLPSRLWLAADSNRIVVYSITSNGQFTSTYSVPILADSYPKNRIPLSKTHSLRAEAVTTDICSHCNKVIHHRKLQCRFCKKSVHQSCANALMLTCCDEK
ncbi:hypothetical protein QTN25_007916 [Entamoeba marina]